MLLPYGTLCEPVSLSAEVTPTVPFCHAPWSCDAALARCTASKGNQNSIMHNDRFASGTEVICLESCACVLNQLTGMQC